MIGTQLHKVLNIRNIDSLTYVLRFERLGMEFAAGQYLTAGTEQGIDMREYSVYSSPLKEDYMEILIREVEQGLISKKLRTLNAGASVRIGGPFGYFLLDKDWQARNYVFIATGTGIAPFHCFVESYPGMQYQLIHGTRHASEDYDTHIYDRSRYIHCSSRGTKADFPGRVTDYLREHRPASDALYYLCGNCDMIYEVYDILREYGIPSEHLHAEVYF